MNVTVTFKVPAEVGVRLGEKLGEVTAATRKLQQQAVAAAKKNATQDNLRAVEELDDLLRRLTSTNMLRIAFMSGAANLPATSELIQMFKDFGMKLGRPSGS